MVDDAWHGDDLVAAHDQRPRLALGTRDLRVDEHVLDLLAPPRKPVAGPPAPYLKPSPRRLDRPLAPPHRPLERHRAGLEPEAVVLARSLQPTAEVDALRSRRRIEQLRERGQQCAPLLE